MSSPSTSTEVKAAAAPAPVKGQPSALKSFLSGGFGGVCLVAAGHPLDTLKVRLQTSNQYKGMADCFRQTVARDGFRGLYRGMLTPLIGVTPTFAVCFWGYDQGKRLSRVLWGNRDASAPLSLAQIGFAGALSAVPTTLLMTPTERIKCVLQVDNSPYKGPLDAARGIIREGGIRGLFTGSVATLARDSVGSVGYFITYEATKKALTPKGGNPGDLSVGAVLFAGGFAGMANWAVAIPIDVIKSRIQTAKPGQYSGMFDVVSKTLKTEGAGALFKGLGPAMVRAFPANAACFVGVEVSLKVMNSLW